MTDYLLFKRKVNPNTLGKDGWSPLEIAVQNGIVEVVQRVISDQRLDLTVQGSKKRGSALHLAASQGNFKMVNVLLFKAPSLLMATDEQNQTAIDVATNPKVIALMKRYQESMKSVGTQLPGEDQTNIAENLNQ